MTKPLTQEQQWGLGYLTQLHNEEAEKHNETLADRNRYIPRDQPLLEERPVITVEEYVELETARLADRGYQQLIAKKEELTKAAFAQATEEQKTELFAMLGVPDILKG